jgi:hypothetical protein
MGILYKINGIYKMAEEYMKDCLKNQKKVLGSDHYDLAKTYNIIG